MQKGTSKIRSLLAAAAGALLSTTAFADAVKIDDLVVATAILAAVAKVSL